MRQLAIHLLAWSAWALTTGCGTPYALSPDNNNSDTQAQSSSTGAPTAPSGQSPSQSGGSPSQSGGSPSPSDLRVIAAWNNLLQDCLQSNGAGFTPDFIGNLQFLGPSGSATPTQIQFTGYPAYPAPVCESVGLAFYPTAPLNEQFDLTMARPDENGCMYYEGTDGSNGNKILAVDWSKCRNRSPEVQVITPNGSRLILTYTPVQNLQGN